MDSSMGHPRPAIRPFENRKYCSGLEVEFKITIYLYYCDIEQRFSEQLQ